MLLRTNLEFYQELLFVDVLIHYEFSEVAVLPVARFTSA